MRLGRLCALLAGLQKISPERQGAASLGDFLADIVDSLHALELEVQSDFRDLARDPHVAQVALGCAARVVGSEALDVQISALECPGACFGSGLRTAIQLRNAELNSVGLCAVVQRCI